MSLATAGVHCTICQRLSGRVRPKFGFSFGYCAETDLTHGFCLVSATAKVHWHKFGFGPNITLKRRKRRKYKTGANCNTSLAVRLLAVGGQGGAYAIANGIDDPKVDSTASYPSSSFHSLPGRVVCYPWHPAPTNATIMGDLVLWLQCTSFV